MKLYTAKQVSNVDSFATKKLRLPSIVLMEHAARDIFEELDLRFVSLLDHKFVVLYGTGNNGGDALAVVRMLLLKGAEVTLVQALGKPKTPDCKLEMEILLNTAKKTKGLKTVPISGVSKHINNSTIVIDGVFGTGFRKSGKPNKNLKKLFSSVEKALFVLAIDIPSGVDADTGSAEDWALSADLTVTLALPKVGLFVSPGAVHSGEVVVRELFTVTSIDQTPYELLDRDYVRILLSKLQRKKESHKGNYGHVLILSPEPGMEGAVCLCANAALKSGAGLVSVAAINETMKDIRKRMPKLPPEVMIKEFDPATLKNYSVVIAGPGFGKKRKKELEQVIKNVKGALVLDADALNIISTDPTLLKLVAKNDNAILTPHPGEMARLVNIKDVQLQRLNVIKLFVAENNVNVILKGYMTLIASREGKIFVNPTGNPGLSKGGSGDVLSGIIASLCAQGLNAVEAGACGVYIHGLCADRLLEAGGSVLNITPSDIINELRNTLRCLIRNS